MSRNKKKDVRPLLSFSEEREEEEEEETVDVTTYSFGRYVT